MTNPATETKSTRAAGRRAGALFFARRLDYFILTKKFRPFIGTWYRQDNLS
jgi:hypothetical protein